MPTDVLLKQIPNPYPEKLPAVWSLCAVLINPNDRNCVSITSFGRSEQMDFNWEHNPGWCCSGRSKYSLGNCSPLGWEWKVAAATFTQHRRLFPRTVGESHIARPHKGVQTWKQKPAVTKRFPQHYESPGSDSRVSWVCSPRRELTILIPWQANPYTIIGLCDVPQSQIHCSSQKMKPLN